MASMISYAQNGEDVVLARAFGDLRVGCYVDVGAHDPVHLSVTKHFYDVGWRGINVEASPRMHARLLEGRPHDINLCVGASSKPGTLRFYEGVGDDVGLSTFASADVERLRAAGHVFRERDVPVERLGTLLDRHLGGRAIDFLTIDVEGHEADVIEGAELGRFRPRVLVIEATRPRSVTPTHEAFEPTVLAAGYEFTLFDGLNRFYVREEDAAELGPALRVPANVHDDYVPHRWWSEVQRLERELEEARRGDRPLVRAAAQFRAAAEAIAGAARQLRRAFEAGRRARHAP
jgi:FkbM family methyltransferase